MSDLTPTENMVRNMKEFMTWRSLNHPTVAKRMGTLGFPWFWTKTGASWPLLDPLDGDGHLMRYAPFDTGRTGLDRWFD